MRGVFKYFEFVRDVRLYLQTWTDWVVPYRPHAPMRIIRVCEVGPCGRLARQRGVCAAYPMRGSYNMMCALRRMGYPPCRGAGYVCSK